MRLPLLRRTNGCEGKWHHSQSLLRLLRSTLRSLARAQSREVDAGRTLIVDESSRFSSRSCTSAVRARLCGPGLANAGCIGVYREHSIALRVTSVFSACPQAYSDNACFASGLSTRSPISFARNNRVAQSVVIICLSSLTPPVNCLSKFRWISKVPGCLALSSTPESHLILLPCSLCNATNSRFFSCQSAHFCLTEPNDSRRIEALPCRLGVVRSH